MSNLLRLAHSRQVLIGLAFLAGCASYGVIDNDPKTSVVPTGSYAIRTEGTARDPGEVGLVLAFSGGGTRAAALAYGVLQELRDTRLAAGGHPRRLLDEVDIISSVSGGSFTAAYYGLYGDRIFEDFERVFLRRNVQGTLIRGLFSPLRWFSSTGRTELAVRYYEDSVFHGATFADLKRMNSPLTLINASDLGRGVRFSFVQEYFNLLCSDISSFQVARAVTASSAVPVLFNPVVVENYRGCSNGKPPWLAAAEVRSQDNPELAQVVAGLSSYLDKNDRRYAHFVDGGITDNLGLRAIYEVVEVAGGIRAAMTKLGRSIPRRLVVISVDASTDPEPKMDRSNRLPSLGETVSAVTDVQLHRYNAATLELMDKSIQRWARELSEPGGQVRPYFIRVAFRDIEEPKSRLFFNQVPTSFSLSDEQVDRLITAGRELLRNNPDYQRLVAELGGTRQTTRRKISNAPIENPLG
jgi:NTE family protein